MIQIFFNQSDRGPGKVIDNFLTGLKQSGENYICNPLDIETDEKAISYAPTRRSRSRRTMEEKIS